MNEKPSRPQHLFIVRLWSETEDLSQASYRGSVEHIPTGQKLYFTSPDDLTDFIALKTTVQSQPVSKGRNPSRQDQTHIHNVNTDKFPILQDGNCEPGAD
jgi:hypothetical protein